MRILFIHPNYHSGGAEIAGTWPPAWVAYLAGSLRAAGFSDIHFIDAMTENVTQDDLRQRMIDLAPDVVGTTAITPAIYVAEEVLKLAAEVVPDALRVLGGIHATFMYRQVLSEAPWVDVIVRGEGEEIMTALMQARRDGDAEVPDGVVELQPVPAVETPPRHIGDAPHHQEPERGQGQRLARGPG